MNSTLTQEEVFGLQHFLMERVAGHTVQQTGIRTEGPDLVTMDIIMQGMDGIDAAEIILKEHPDARGQPPGHQQWLRWRLPASVPLSAGPLHICHICGIIPGHVNARGTARNYVVFCRSAWFSSGRKNQARASSNTFNSYALMRSSIFLFSSVIGLPHVFLFFSDLWFVRSSLSHPFAIFKYSLSLDPC